MRSTTATAKAWRRSGEARLSGVGASIDRRFGRWPLSRAEVEVGLLLLEGRAHEDIAHISGIGDATAHQQARAVHRKAGVTGRNDLAAFLLQDLALPLPRE